jgi:hypothetical protein
VKAQNELQAMRKGLLKPVRDRADLA